jgi:aspartyl-tRNA(Asn)/glutamyl-tRNA(Gln) amidotransferase subunit A
LEGIAVTEMPLTLTDAADALRGGALTSVELTGFALAVADRFDPEVGSFIARYPEASLASAARADELLSAGTDLGPLHGMPFVVKDIISTTEGPTTAQSLILDPAWGESAGDAVVVRRLRAAGAVIVGKATTMEFACGMPDPDKPFPVPRNPWNLDRWPGGSSSGTASSVAAGMGLAGLGTDTAGSIRIPSAYCGITGLKPTFGRVPKSGVVPLGYTLDNVGPMARSARDCAAVLEVIAGHDPSDPYCADVPAQPWSAALTGDLAGVRIGVDDLAGHLDEAPGPTQQAAFTAAVDVLRAAGAEVVPVSLPLWHEMIAVDLVVMLSEAFAYHAPDLRGRWSDYGRGTRLMIASGAAFSGADYVQAQRVRRVGQQALARMFDDVDAIVTPTASTGALALADLDTRVGGSMDLMRSIHTPYWNSAGHPTLAVPIGLDEDGLPLSMQISTRPFDEALALRAGDAFQQHTGFHLLLPPLVRGMLAAA